MKPPNRACRTCKQRRVKCDEAQPVCNRCQKSNLVCHRAEERKLIFLDENEYAVGKRKRPRGPNTKTAAVCIIRDTTKSRSKLSPKNVISKNPKVPSRYPKDVENVVLLPTPPPEAQRSSIPLALTTPLTEQALTYYSRCYIESPPNLPEIADGHLSHVLVSSCFSHPHSVLSLAIAAVSHATFGRARRSPAALAVGRSTYSKALTKTNQALRDVDGVVMDEVLLAVMLLSFYENSVTERSLGKKAETNSNVVKEEKCSGIEDIAARSFAHHDGAMAVLSLRRQSAPRRMKSLELDKLVRRQLLRSLLLRSMPVPPWLRDGEKFGECGIALGLDRGMVETASLRYQISTIAEDSSAGLLLLGRHEEMMRLRRLLVGAQALDDLLVLWTNNLPPQDCYNTFVVEREGTDKVGNMVFDSTVHVYPTVGHAGMWNRYRALRLTVNDNKLKILSILARFPHVDTASLTGATHLKIQQLADDLCASVPYMLGLLENSRETDGVAIITCKDLGSLKGAVKGATASFLCWPLTMATMVSSIPAQHQRYLRDRLLDVSEIVDDGVLERVADGFSSPSPNPTETHVFVTALQSADLGIHKHFPWTARSSTGFDLLPGLSSWKT
ncbi:uncharacterized protein BDZ99DRAFT_574562 [Mytilinidion resinicola]|uniref:Zn(2)-C6 fungal-type domain-containing protein n=1 Tax=Mytilinidion resinicola TaxID=574789 RepID=A0A6A6YAF7_9PEZI|nr:uncharacterized protein BDZ99DRAFT_574562 [Mytilinidion resinicola]KAF2805680.1 hypothetical protein BDZ99DRAFT_574562 [Mytilinidion resinicola]